MKTAENILAFAHDYARGLVRGTKTPQHVVEVVEAIRKGELPTAAALFALEVASHVPDSIEVELRQALATPINPGASLHLRDESRTVSELLALLRRARCYVKEVGGLGAPGSGVDFIPNMEDPQTRLAKQIDAALGAAT